MNLKGAKFEKQVRDAFFKVLAYGKGRNMKDDNLTHSLAVGDKRMMYLNDFKEFIKEQGIQEGKLNKLMTEENIRDFLDQRTVKLSPKTGLDYVSGFNSLLKGLEQVNITIPANPTNNDFLQDFREQFREEMKKLEFEKGLRVNEAMEVVKNFEKYYNEQNSTLNGVIGKGNHEYQSKTISPQLATEIQKMEHIPHYNTYRADLKKVDIDRSHNFRVTYAKDLLNKKLEQGIEYKEALEFVSKEINHHRAEITKYYIARA